MNVTIRELRYLALWTVLAVAFHNQGLDASNEGNTGIAVFWAVLFLFSMLMIRVIGPKGKGNDHGNQHG